MCTAAKTLLVAAVAAAFVWPAAADEAGVTDRPAEAPARPSPEEELVLLMTALADPAAANPEKIAERIIELWSLSGSDTADFLLRRGRDAMNRSDLPAAIDHLSALIDHAPDFAEGWNARATAYFMREDLALSLSDVEQAIRLNPQHFGALAGLGIILEQLGEEALALKAFRSAFALNPHEERVREAIDRLAPKVDGTAL